MQYPTLPLVLSASMLAACGSNIPLGSMGAPQARAVAQLGSASGSQVGGMVTFTEAPGGMRVAGEVRGLRPNAEHGFHVHEKGDCTAPDATSAGGHFNPGGHAHGAPGQGSHHAGDLRNLRADGNGVARIDQMVPMLRVSEGATAIVGRGLVVHRDPDDYSSQPAGNSGARIACAVIQRG